MLVGDLCSIRNNRRLSNSQNVGSQLSNSFIQASNEYGEKPTGFQRTKSAQKTLSEATRLLFSMPRPQHMSSDNPELEPTGLSSPLTSLMMTPLISNRNDDGEDGDNDGNSQQNDNLFLKLST
ncbi:unnamed protein product [Schistosoma curassoni]|uniref:Uncharacterized protein n=1 Tax=Schistosoma curassoni TaxID=6186 RepID=A0A183JPY7_9TREM|nr:unnamed protein product [Schistosoma curassoni]